jgi:hypothetical protein
LEQEVPLNMDALLALSIVTFFETFFCRKKYCHSGTKNPMQLITKDLKKKGKNKHQSH